MARIVNFGLSCFYVNLSRFAFFRTALANRQRANHQTDLTQPPSRPTPLLRIRTKNVQQCLSERGFPKHWLSRIVCVLGGFVIGILVVPDAYFNQGPLNAARYFSSPCISFLLFICRWWTCIIFTIRPTSCSARRANSFWAKRWQRSSRRFYRRWRATWGPFWVSS